MRNRIGPGIMAIKRLSVDRTEEPSLIFWPEEQSPYKLERNYAFPADMKIRFMCDASDNRDDVYIDEIRVSAK